MKRNASVFHDYGETHGHFGDCSPFDVGSAGQCRRQRRWHVEPVQTTTVEMMDQATWTFDLPASLQPVTVEWRAHLQGEGPEQSTPWFALQSEIPSLSVDQTAAYAQSLAMLLMFMVAFMSLQRRGGLETDAAKDDAFSSEVAR